MTKPAFICSHGHAYSEFELECGMTYEYMDWLMEEGERQYNLEQDLKTENELALQHVAGELECPWPWYADAPLEVVRPEIIGGDSEIHGSRPTG